ncbi:MAG: transporter, ATPase subunit [Bryobacterales bacterium]|nr:transporter, ATPase subunit [Bryobacterales bacterium]
MKEFLRLENVSKLYTGAGGKPVRALDDITFTANGGEWIAIMGPSGSGKTTLLNILGCLDQATTGVVRIGATDTSTLNRAQLARFRSETVGFVFQQFHLIPHLNALENVMLAQYFHSMPDKDEARKALEQVGLGTRAAHLPSQLSGGEQQRVAIARALVNDPKIILADEPTGNLDAENQIKVLNILSGLHAQGRTILMVTHDDIVGRRADRRLNLEHGRIVVPKQLTAEENQKFDEVLEQLWMAREREGNGGAPHLESTHFTTAQHRKLTTAMAQVGLVTVSGWNVQFTAAGEARARAVIRRHRLAERLFMDVLAMRDDAVIESDACTFEHILSPELTDRICTFLGHPETCPHGSPIPRGECCGAHRSGPETHLLHWESPK